MRTSFVLAMSIFLAPFYGRAFAIAADSPPAKSPVPAADAQTQAGKLIREVYGSEYAAAKTAQQKTTLAKKMIEKAMQSADDAASQYVLLKTARDIAAAGGDLATAFQAIEQLDRAFTVDALAMKAAVLAKVETAARQPSQLKSIAEEALGLIDDAVAADKTEILTELADLALAASRKLKDKDLLKQAQRRKKDVEQIVQAAEEVQSAKKKLEDAPNDPAANSIVGRYLCFVKGDWEQGVPMLALGDDAELKKLATRDIEGAKDAKEQAALGDAWWDLSETKAGREAERMKERSYHWYKQAMPGLTGLAKDKVEKRLQQTAMLDDRPRSQQAATEPGTEARRSKPGAKGKVRPQLFAFTNEAAIKRDWEVNGDWRIEESGLKLTGGGSTLKSAQSFSGDFGIQISYSMDARCELWLSMWGETFCFEKAGKSVATLVRKGDIVTYMCDGDSPKAVKLKESQVSDATPVLIHLDRRNLYRPRMELIVHGIAIQYAGDR